MSKVTETLAGGRSANQMRLPEYNNSAFFAGREKVICNGSLAPALGADAAGDSCAGEAPFSTGRVMTLNGQLNASKTQSVNAARNSGEPFMNYFNASTNVFTL
jgi:hypothetical protein